MFNRLNSKEYLLMGFGSVLLLLAIILATAFNMMASINGDLQIIVDNRYPKVELANKALKLTLDNARLVRTAVLYTAPQDINDTLAKAEANRALNRQVLAQMKSLINTPRGLELFARVEETHAAMGPLYDTLYALARANDDAGSIEFIKTRFAPANNTYMAALEALSDFQKQMMETSATHAKDNYHSALWTMGILGAVSFVAGILIALWIAGIIVRAVNETSRVAERIAAGDLTPCDTSLTLSERNELGRMMAVLQDTRSKLAKTLKEINDNANYVADSAHQLSSMSEQVAISTQRQAESTTTSAATLEQLTVSINHVADNAGDAARQASTAGQIAAEGNTRVVESVEQIRSVHGSVGATANQMTELTGEVQQIGNIVTVIRDVADQTNLLALNAAIEAARAGETGRGFAVVADEVRKLAERTAQSAQEITAMITSIQDKAQHAVNSMEQSTHEVESVNQTAGETGEAMQQMVDSTEGVKAAIGAINGALDEQRIASQGLAKDMEQVAQMAEENSATVEELATTSSQLMSLSQTLKGVVERFKL